MTYTPTIYDWRANVAPVDQLFRAAGEVVPGGLTLGGFLVDSPEPGGRGELVLTFAPLASEAANRDASWTMSRIADRSVMQIPIWDSVQLVPASALNEPLTNGIPWGNNEPWATDENWAWSPWVPVTDAAAKGQSEFAVNMAGLGQILELGHLVGFESRFTHIVMEVTYIGNIATVKVSPPLRRAIAIDDQMQFRPTFTGQCANPGEVAAVFRSGRHAQLGTARFTEALV